MGQRVDEFDPLFRALADPSRRRLLDLLHAHDGRTLRELCRHLDMTRQGVTQHLHVLEAANLVATVRRGREKLHFLNPVPLQAIYQRWIAKFEESRLEALHELKRRLEEPMARSTFVYVAYIRTTPEQLWSALTDVEFMKRYWFGMYCESEWTPGSAWKMVAADGQIVDAGEIVAAEPPRRLVIRWRHQKNAELRAEGESLCTMEVEPSGTAVKLAITHTIDRDPSKFIQAVSDGWPKIISSLKSLLETGAAIDAAHDPRHLEEQVS